MAVIAKVRRLSTESRGPVTIGIVLLAMTLSAMSCRDGGGPDTTAPTTAAPRTTTASPTTTSPPATTATTSAPATTSPPPTTPTLSGRITSPEERASVFTETFVRGTIAGVPPGSQVWTVVEIGRYYPQDGPMPVLPDGGWSGTVFIGAPGDAGKNFQIHLVVTGPTGITQFTNYLKVGRETLSFPGIPREQLAPDVKFVATISVVRS